MDAVKFINERRRMCDSYNTCSECPIHSDTKMDCDKYLNTHPENYVKTVEKWSAEHPEKARQSEFLKLYPNARMVSGAIDICPKALGERIKQECGRFPIFADCVDCQKDYWLKEVKE